MLGLFDKFMPKFVKQFANIRQPILDALTSYRDEVRDGRFPTADHTYSMKPEEVAAFQQKVAETQQKE
jgi:3-methyl-2-oxobutanoate hydroxymethyltransferase